MLILVSSLILFITMLILMILQAVQPTARYAWLVGAGGTLLALISAFFWLGRLPLEFAFPTWQPGIVFKTPIRFQADGMSWALSLSILVLTVAILLTTITRSTATNALTWAGTLGLAGIGILAITADNPLTLLLAWGALDLMELLAQVRAFNSPASNERIVISFSVRAFGIGVLLWANIISIAAGSNFTFQSIAPNSGLYLVLAAGLRLGVLPLHLPFLPKSDLRRGFGTLLRLVTATASLVLLAHIPMESLNSQATPFLIGLAVIAALYSSWMWMRAPDDLTGRPYWIINIASFAVISTLSGNPTGAIAWGCALILVGGALFLASNSGTWVDRALLTGVWSLSALPFSLTASAWVGNPGIFIPFVIIAQAMLIAGLVRHVLRSGGRSKLEAEPGWAGRIYPAGIFLLVAFQWLLGLFGWQGARQLGAWLQAVIVLALTAGLVWALPRFRVLNPLRASWLNPAIDSLSKLYRGLWRIYRFLGRITGIVTIALEGESGIMWTLLLLTLFISFVMQGIP